jgi:hypothetical protein
VTGRLAAELNNELVEASGRFSSHWPSERIAAVATPEITRAQSQITSIYHQTLAAGKLLGGGGGGSGAFKTENATQSEPPNRHDVRSFSTCCV